MIAVCDLDWKEIAMSHDPAAAVVQVVNSLASVLSSFSQKQDPAKKKICKTPVREGDRLLSGRYDFEGESVILL